MPSGQGLASCTLMAVLMACAGCGPSHPSGTTGVTPEVAESSSPQAVGVVTSTAANVATGNVSETPPREVASAAAETAAPRAPLTALQVLDRMARAYRRADTYRDSGQLRQRIEYGGQLLDETVDFSVTFARPNKLRMHFYQAVLASDGQRYRASIADLPLQVLDISAPAELNLSNLHGDETLQAVLTGGIAGGSPQLALLLTDDALNSFLGGGQPPVLLEPDHFDDRVCYRVQVSRPDGLLLAWIDRETFELRRLDYPTEGLRKQLAQQNQVGTVELWAEFSGARLGGEIEPVAFEFEVPGDAHRVSRFVVMPVPPPPSKLLGTALPEANFTQLNGSSVSLADLRDKVVILDFWATWCAPCFQSLPNLQQVYQRYREHPRVAFLAVSIDVDDVTDPQVKDAFAKAGLSLPIVRDRAQQAQSIFGIEGIPSLFILGPDGVVQDQEIGFNANLVQDLPSRIEKILRGESLYPEVQLRYQQQLASHEAQLRSALAAVASDGNALASGAAQAAPASSATQLQLARRWICQDLQRPGNIMLAAGPSSEPRVLVLDGFQQVAELSATGQVVSRHNLDLSGQMAVSVLRAAVDGQGRQLFLGLAANQPSVHVYDDQFHRLLRFPDNEPAEIMDAQLVDLDGDGRLELAVGYWGVVGVQGVKLSGERLWQNRSMENVTSLVAVPITSGKGHGLLCTQARGTIVPLNPQGGQSPDIPLANRFVRSLIAADLNHDGQPEFCGVALASPTQEVLLGLTAGGEELWNYPLPPGIHDQPIEMITTGDLVRAGIAQWIAAGADGSIHVLGPDGRLIDRFNYGAKLTGLNVAQFGEQPLLLISSGQTVEALGVESGRAP